MLFRRRPVLVRRHSGVVLCSALFLFARDLARAILALCALIVPVHKELFPRRGAWGNRRYMIFADRADAGKQLAERLAAYAGPETRVFGLPRGGVPVAFEVAKRLGAPLDVYIVRKLGAPGREELALGAIASNGVKVLNRETIEALGIDDAALDAIARREAVELERRESLYRAGRLAQDIAGRTVLIVDDGLATGASMYAAVLAIRAQDPRRVVVAVPVAPKETLAQLSEYADEVVCLSSPEPFRGVGAWYADFRQITDQEVRDCLHAA